MKKLLRKFKDSSFVAHISFLWHWKNFLFLRKYPFWKCYNKWTGKFIGYAYSDYNLICDGWRIAFGEQLSEEIKQAGKASRKRLGKHVSWKKLLQWQQIKEKWGTLRMYASCTEEIQHVIEKYEYMSYGYCINCGKPARYRTEGWVSYQCEDCFANDLSHYVEGDEKTRVLNECRLKVKDLPHGTNYTTNKNGKMIAHKINYKKIYGVDLRKLWGLDK